MLRSKEYQVFFGQNYAEQRELNIFENFKIIVLKFIIEVLIGILRFKI